MNILTYSFSFVGELLFAFMIDLEISLYRVKLKKDHGSFTKSIYTITLLKHQTFFRFYWEQKMNTNQHHQQQPFWLFFLLYKRTHSDLQVILFYLYFIGCPKRNYDITIQH